jgi:hypothetical protein
MANNFFFSSSATLDSELTSLSIAGSPTTQDFTVYFGATATGLKVEANSDPGNDQITVSIVDADPGNGHEAAEIKLALTEAGLDTATGGADLDLGTSITSGTSNKKTIWIRATNAEGSYYDLNLSLAINELVESSV